MTEEGKVAHGMTEEARISNVHQGFVFDPSSMRPVIHIAGWELHPDGRVEPSDKAASLDDVSRQFWESIGLMFPGFIPAPAPPEEEVERVAEAIYETNPMPDRTNGRQRDFVPWAEACLYDHIGSRCREQATAALSALPRRETVPTLTEEERGIAGRLHEALGWFLNDSRFQVGVGGNPDVVESMIAEAREVYSESEAALSLIDKLAGEV